MTDYSKLKVTDLKAELKRRGIAQTGLRVKQQIIDRLEEEDAREAAGQDATAEPGSDRDNAQEEEEELEEEEEEEEEEEDEVSEPTPETEEVQQEVQPAQPVEPQADSATHAEPVPEETVEQMETEVSTQPPEQTPESVVDQIAARGNQVAEESPEQPKEEVEPSTKAQELEETVVATDTSAVQETTAEPPAVPVEQAPGNESAQEINAELKETAPPTSIPSELNTALSTPLPTEELLEDRRKRKRRSQSPVPTPEALAIKKAKAQEEEPRVLLPEDQGSSMMEVDQQEEEGAALSREPPEARAEPETAAPGRETESAPAADDTTLAAKKDAPPKHDVRFKGLFAGPGADQARPPSPPPDVAVDEAEVEPALHAATAALYVGGLMRPMQPAALRSHLVTLASAPDASPNADVILDYYLDPIKTHCFVSFTSVSAASRVRTALHGTVWPNERNRKALFVDFIPEDKLKSWIEREEGTRQRGGPAPRWEVRYDRTDDGVEAVLEEVDSRKPAAQAARAPDLAGFSRPPPTGPRAEGRGPTRRPSSPGVARSNSHPGQGFKPLDELFMSTTTKPKLYYLPVTREVADRRLDRFDDLLRKGAFPRRGGDETRRITFEDGDLFVDKGPEYLGGGRGRRGGRGGGRGRGGGMGDSWRDDRRSRW
ncbi:hypothetical protein ASPACDRAFT_81044 [Aspergillus aculeatus ATCC 16872]|uniref:SAP domain-containing protein n=1 Tax=Aspergillus aculeatus (strain ATCC 16872 / CBS 172.66 / WB 5094) TaxID=690307 RepID=A0A1L9WL06_ASPA1|nr:uncharacterized protein ASPACDRAFT_81044 [Aspergillus aculeatus ATCC 16872]OJJ96830.1 hypothetical protein ASPACDRAFT_81044 [Aspergillus aculeatus ATCC 16872]